MFKVQTRDSEWTRVAFGDVVRRSIERSRNPAADGFERVVGLEHINPGDLRLRSWRNVSDGTTFTNVFRPGQVLFGKRRAYQRKVALADFSGLCSGDIYVLESKGGHLLPELLPYICQTDAFLEHAVATSAGSLSPRTNWTSLASFELALPPLAEQRRLAAAFQAVDAYGEALRHLSQKCFALWIPILRERLGLESSSDERALVLSEGSTTPSGWPMRRVVDICSSDRQGVQVGPFGGSVSSRHFAPKGVPVVKINNITELGELDLEDMVYLNTSQARSLSERYSVRPGDLLTAAQATVGRTALADERVDRAIISQHIIRISPDSTVCEPAWLHALFSSPLVLSQIQRAVQGGTRAGLNTADVENIRVPIPALREQRDACADMGAARLMASESSERLAALFDVRARLLAELIKGGQ